MANSSIENVQEAETKAKKILENAEKRKADRLDKANQDARRILDEAEAKTKSIKDNAIKKAGGELEKERERRLSDARNEAKRIQKMELSKNAIKGVVDKVIRQIFS